MSGYGSGRPGGPSGREVDPEWVAWAEEQTVKLLRAQERFTYLPPSTADEGVPPHAAEQPGDPPPSPGTLEDDPIRVVQELHLDDPDQEPLSSEDDAGHRVIDLADGRRLVVRVHSDNLPR